MTYQFDPRNLHMMSGDRATADKYHPMPEESQTYGSGTVFGCKNTEADNVFANGGEAAIIWGARVDARVAGVLSILDGATESGAGIIAAVQSTTTVEDHGPFPIYCPNGFHIDISTAAVWQLSWSQVPKRGA
jgi:hypothetical protein